MNFQSLLYNFSTTWLWEKYVQEICYVYYLIKVPGRYPAWRIQPSWKKPVISQPISRHKVFEVFRQCHFLKIYFSIYFSNNHKLHMRNPRKDTI